jgi:hypothetical protein
LLEDLVFDDSPLESDIIAMDNSLDNMVETYGDIKELINNAMDNFRRSNLTVIHGGKNTGPLFRMIQISISGLDVWRRAIITHEYTMTELHKLIQISMGWKGQHSFRFYCETPEGGKEYLRDTAKLGDIDFHGKKEIIYEYGTKWIIKVMIMSSYQPANNEAARFVAGDGAAPPEQLDGPRHFNKLMYFLETGGNAEKQSAQKELGLDFVPDQFDLDKLNRNLQDVMVKGK